MTVILGILSSILFLILITIIGWLYQYFSGRKKLFEFFNLKNTKRLVLYLSHLRIASGGAVGVDNIPRSFGESAIPLSETRLVSLFQRLFISAIPGIDTLPGILKKIVISDVDLNIEPSPLDENTVEKDTTIISLGSPGYNIASKYIENTLNSIGKFINQNSAIEIPDTPPYRDTLYSFVQRTKNNSSGAIAYYAAGISSISTMGVSYFLSSKWRYLQNKYGNTQPFCIILKISPEDYKKHTIVCKKFE